MDLGDPKLFKLVQKHLAARQERLRGGGVSGPVSAGWSNLDIVSCPQNSQSGHLVDKICQSGHFSSKFSVGEFPSETYLAALLPTALQSVRYAFLT